MDNLQGKGDLTLGFAKYMEDDIEIYNNRMYDRGTKLATLSEFKKAQKKKPHSTSEKEEYLLVLGQIEGYEERLGIIDRAKETITTKSILQLMDSQQRHFTKVRDEYIDYKFSPKFRAFWDIEYNAEEDELREFRRGILENYVQKFIDSLKAMENLTGDDAIAINFLYWDIENFAREFLSVDKEFLEVPLVQYLREDILKENELAWVLCPNCRGKTYKDFRTCILCKYPNEVV